MRKTRKLVDLAVDALRHAMEHGDADTRARAAIAILDAGGFTPTDTSAEDDQQAITVSAEFLFYKWPDLQAKLKGINDLPTFVHEIKRLEQELDY